MVRCIRLCLDCSDVCTATAGVISRPADYDTDVARSVTELLRLVEDLHEFLGQGSGRSGVLPGVQVAVHHGVGLPYRAA